MRRYQYHRYHRYHQYHHQDYIHLVDRVPTMVSTNCHRDHQDYQRWYQPIDAITHKPHDYETPKTSPMSLNATGGTNAMQVAAKQNVAIMPRFVWVIPTALTTVPSMVSDRMLVRFIQDITML